MGSGIDGWVDGKERTRWSYLGGVALIPRAMNGFDFGIASEPTLSGGPIILSSTGVIYHVVGDTTDCPASGVAGNQFRPLQACARLEASLKEFPGHMLN